MDLENRSSGAPTPIDAKRVARTLFDYVEMLALAVAAVLILFTFLFRLSVVSGNSMYGTLHDDDKLIISNLLYTPKTGDIVVFENDGYTQTGEPLIKRVIATEGQFVRLGADGSVYVYEDENDTVGKKLNEPYASLAVLSRDGTYLGEQSGYYNTLDYLVIYEKYREKTEVPEGKIFVLGDHRNSSYDSRYFGMIDERLVLGRVLFRVSPFNQFGAVD